jgi:hypothetical protein
MGRFHDAAEAQCGLHREQHGRHPYADGRERQGKSTIDTVNGAVTGCKLVRLLK